MNTPIQTKERRRLELLDKSPAELRSILSYLEGLFAIGSSQSDAWPISQLVDAILADEYPPSRLTPRT